MAAATGARSVAYRLHASDDDVMLTSEAVDPSGNRFGTGVRGGAVVRGQARSEDQPPGTSGGGRRGVRDTLLVLLTVASGGVDAVCFFGLGQVFTAMMTGNLVLLGLAAGQGEASAALRSGVAVAGYAVAAYVAARWLPRAAETDPWPRRITVVVVVELLLQAVVALVWMAVRGVPPVPVQLSLIAGYALAMGAQSAVARALAVPGVTTTYVTGTLTDVLADLAHRGGRRWNTLHRVTVVVAVAIGAGGAGFLLHVAPLAAPFLPLAITTVVVVTGLAVFHRRAAAVGG